MTQPANPNQGHESFQMPSPGPSSVLEYQASGLPFVTQSTAVPVAPSGSVTRVDFPFVTRFLTIKNNGGDDLYVGFTANGVQNTNRFTISSGSSYTGEMRIAEIFFTTPTTTASFEIIAGLTQIPRRNWFVLTGALNGFSGSQVTYGMRGFGYPGIG